MLNIKTYGVALPHVDDLRAIEDQIKEHNDAISALAKIRIRMRQENHAAEIHQAGWFTLDDITAQYYFKDTYAAGQFLAKACMKKQCERMELGAWRFIPQHSDTDWNADLPLID